MFMVLLEVTKEVLWVFLYTRNTEQQPVSEVN